VSWLGDQRGETSLTGLLVAMVLFAVVLGATLDAFSVFDTRSHEEAERNDAEQTAQTAVETLSRELRNLAQPQSDAASTIERATGFDLVFKTVARTGAPTAGNPANVVRVRYCLGTTTGRRLYYQTQPWTSASSAPADGACPSSAWPTSRVVADLVSNRSTGQSRPVFAYNTADARRIESVHVDLFLDTRPGAGPKETELSSGVFLRNQNQPPTALFTATPQGTSIVLSGSQSADPEGEPLKFQFYDKTSGTAVAIPGCAAVTCTWTPTGTGPFTIGLTVTDSGGIAVDAPDLTNVRL
jgi:type II secretory pathway pseudopilin PulG